MGGMAWSERVRRLAGERQGVVGLGNWVGTGEGKFGGWGSVGERGAGGRGKGRGGRGGAIAGIGVGGNGGKVLSRANEFRRSVNQQ